MPKKSKKEKIIADLRRKVQTQQTLTVHTPTLIKEDTTPTFTFQVKNKESAQPQQHLEQNTTELVAIKRDLSKTFILATLAIAAEIIIYLFHH